MKVKEAGKNKGEIYAEFAEKEKAEEDDGQDQVSVPRSLHSATAEGASAPVEMTIGGRAETSASGPRVDTEPRGTLKHLNGSCWLALAVGAGLVEGLEELIGADDLAVESAGDQGVLFD